MEIKISKDEVFNAIKEDLKKRGLNFDSAIISMNNLGGANIILIKDGRKI
jgi:hypothetical protein